MRCLPGWHGYGGGAPGGQKRGCQRYSAIPKKWDDSFTAFNQVVGESGLTLAVYKGKTVEKWTVLCPARSDGATDTYCVLLVYKAKPVGAYLLEKPSGEVSGLITAAQTAAEAEQQAAETSAALPDEADYPSE